MDIYDFIKKLLEKNNLSKNEIERIIKHQQNSRYEPKIGNMYMYLLHVVTKFSLCAQGEYKLKKDRPVDIAILPRTNLPLLVEVKRHKILHKHEELARLRNQLKSYIKLSLEKYKSLIPIIVLIDHHPKMQFEKFKKEIDRLMSLIKREIRKYCKDELKINMECEKYISYIIVKHDENGVINYVINNVDPLVETITGDRALFFDPQGTRFERALIRC